MKNFIAICNLITSTGKSEVISNIVAENEEQVKRHCEYVHKNIYTFVEVVSVEEIKLSV